MNSKVLNDVLIGALDLPKKPYTTSVSLAWRLAVKLSKGGDLRVHSNKQGFKVYIRWFDVPKKRYLYCASTTGKTLELAICLAILEAINMSYRY